MKKFVVAFVLLFGACDNSSALTKCGEYEILAQDFELGDQYPQIYLPSFSVFGLPKSSELRPSILSIDQFSHPTKRTVYFASWEGCFKLDRVYDDYTAPATGGSEHCFESIGLFKISPLNATSALCDDRFCAADRNLEDVAATLSEISREIQPSSSLGAIGLLEAGRPEFSAFYKVDWFDGVPLYQVELNAADGELVVRGVHAERGRSGYSVCRERDLSKIMGWGEDFELD